MEGYIFTAQPHEAFHAKELFPTIRYTAHLEDGTGFCAFDLYHPQMHEFGEVRIVEPQSFLHPMFVPKRARVTGMEWFARIAADRTVAERLADLDEVTGLAYLDDGMMLVESQGPIAAGFIRTNAKVIWAEQRELVTA